MRRLYRWLVQRSIPHLIRVACVLALLALSVMAYSVVSLKPLPVVFAMSVGQGIGVVAFCLYLLAVVLDTQRSSAAPCDPPPPADPGPELPEADLDSDPQPSKS